MPEIRNLVVDLAARRAAARPPRGVELAPPAAADERTLAWIDETFGGAWSSEAYAGSTIVAQRDGAPVGFATVDPRGLTYAWLGGLARERAVGLLGPIGVALQERGMGVGRALLAAAANALRERGYARALVPAVTGDALTRYYAKAIGATVAERFDDGALLRPARRTIVLASGRGSNFAAVLDAVAQGALPLQIAGLVCNDPRAPAIERAPESGVTARVVAWDRAAQSRAQYDARLLETARAFEPDLVLLLGWMHLLDEAFVRAFPELLNLHPAFLPLAPERDEVVMPDGTRMPAFRGARAVRDALAASSAWTGATLHRVTADTDRGPVMARAPLRLRHGEEEADVMERLHPAEHRVVAAGLRRWLYER